MKNIEIEGSPKTPEINFNAESGVIEIKGRSIPENSIEFYKPMIDWLEEYATAPKTKTTVNIQLEYFNTSSSKCILDVFKKLEIISKNGNEVQVSGITKDDKICLKLAKIISQLSESFQND